VTLLLNSDVVSKLSGQKWNSFIVPPACLKKVFLTLPPLSLSLLRGGRNFSAPGPANYREIFCGREQFLEIYTRYFHHFSAVYVCVFMHVCTMYFIVYM